MSTVTKPPDMTDVGGPFAGKIEPFSELPLPNGATPSPSAEAARAAGGKARGRPLQGKGLDLADTEPADDSVDGETLFCDISKTVERYLVLPDLVSVTVALWIALTYLVDAVDVLPRLLLTSPTRECGKTRLLALVGALVQRPLPAASISPAALFRAIDAAAPTLILDEMDNARLAENPELRALLNSGHSRTSAWTVRNVGEQHEPRRFSTWAPLAFACIGTLPDTVASRCVRVAMRRRPPGQRIERLRESRIGDELEPLRRRLARWARDHGEEIGKADPHPPDGLGDREVDNWTPLLAIADVIGGSWPAAARRAALAMSGVMDDEEPAIMLLTDLREIFSEREVDRLASQDIVASLVKLEGRPWPEWQSGKPLTVRGLARMLKRFGVEPRTVKFHDGTTAKGYHRDVLEGAWRPYLPPNASPPSPTSPIVVQTPFSTPSPDAPVTDAKTTLDPREKPTVTLVTDRSPDGGVDGMVARLERSDWVPADNASFPTQREHEEVCARLGLVPTPSLEPEGAQSAWDGHPGMERPPGWRVEG